MSLLLAFHPKVTAAAGSNGALSSNGSATAAFGGAARTAGALSISGISTVTFGGAARNSGAVSSAGVGAFAVGGSSTARAALSVTGSGSVTFAGGTGGTVAGGALYAVASTPITGLDFPSNGDSPSLARIAFRFTGSILPDIAPLTIIWRYYPVQHSGFHTTFFHGRGDGGFLGDATYFGCHPYPVGGSSGTTHNWEISATGFDNIIDANGNDTTVVKDQWYQQAAVAQNLTDAQIDFWWDLATSSGRRIRSTLSGFTLTNSAFSPELIFGDATWAPATERMSGLFRGLQIYQGVLTESQIEQLSPLETDAAVIAKASDLGLTLFYCNINPTQADITDKSGNARDPAWQDASNKAADWTGTAAGAAAVTFAGNAAARAALSITGSGTASFAGAARTAGAVSFAGAATVALAGSSRAAGAIRSDGVATASFVGATASAAAGALSVAGQSTAAFAGSAVSAGALNSASSGTAALAGAAVNAGAMLSQSGGDAIFGGATVIAGGGAALAVASQSTVALAGSSIAGGALMSASGTDVAFAGGSIQPAAMFSVSGASIIFTTDTPSVPDVEEPPVSISEPGGGAAGRNVWDLVKQRRRRLLEAKEKQDIEDLVALIELIESHGMKRAA